RRLSAAIGTVPAPRIPRGAPGQFLSLLPCGQSPVSRSLARPRAGRFSFRSEFPTSYFPHPLLGGAAKAALEPVVYRGMGRTKPRGAGRPGKDRGDIEVGHREAIAEQVLAALERAFENIVGSRERFLGSIRELRLALPRRQGEPME